MMSTNNILSPATGRPIIGPTQDIVLGCYYMTQQRQGSRGEGRRFSNPSEVRIAEDSGELSLHAAIQVRLDGKMEETTAGRVLLREIVPPEIPFEFINQVMDKKALGELIDQAYRRLGNKATVLLADKLRTLGFTHATRAGVSVCVDDMHVPSDKQALIERANHEVSEIDGQYQEGLITDGERYNKVIDIWAQTTETITSQVLERLGTETVINDEGEEVSVPSFNSIFMMADSGARGSAQQIRQLAGMRGLMAKPSGEIIETPITSNFREGLSVLQYFISTHGARKGLADTALKTANSGYLTRRLVDVAQDMIVRERDCETEDGIAATPLIEGGEIVEPLGERILGRTALQTVYDPVNTDEVLVVAGSEIDEDKVHIIENAGVEKVMIRSVLTCETKRGTCVLCYGRDLARGTLVNLGEAVGVIAAQSIGEPGTQLTMRTFHIGGTATRRAEQSSAEAASEGVVKLTNVRTVIDREKRDIAMTRNGEIEIFDASGREKERHPVVLGAHILVKEGQKVVAGEKLCEWDPHANPILSELAGKVKYADLTEGSTYQEQVDEFTGLSSRVIIESKDPDMRPRLVVEGDSGERTSLLPVGAFLATSPGDDVSAGDVLARIPREATKTKDITGGLPRVAELFEARKPKEHAVVTEINGLVSFGTDVRGKRRVVVTPEEDNGEPQEYLIPKGKHISVHEGDRVRPGEALMDGSSNPHDILKIKGEKELAKYLVDEVQEVYRLQGVRINDKHIETIVRQMLRRVRVVDPGDSEFLVGESVERAQFEEVHAELLAQGKQTPQREGILLGITKASLSTESFISAASFQETTKVLTEAAIWGKTDRLFGLKENVIMGRLIPAGTGTAKYRDMGIQIEAPDELLVGPEEDDLAGDALLRTGDPTADPALGEVAVTAAPPAGSES